MYDNEYLGELVARQPNVITRHFGLFNFFKRAKIYNSKNRVYTG